VSIALDQRAVDEQVAIANSHLHLDSFLAGFFRDGGVDAPPIISNEEEKCEISVVRPKTIPGVRAASRATKGYVYTVITIISVKYQN
jgi:hypothetical protein